VNWHLTGDEAGNIVDDCEATKTQRNPTLSVDPNAVIVRAAMSDRIAHAPCYSVELFLIPPTTTEKSGQAAHVASRLSGSIRHANRTSDRASACGPLPPRIAHRYHGSEYDDESPRSVYR